MTITENTDRGTPFSTTRTDGHSGDCAPRLSDVEITYVPLRSPAPGGTTAAETTVEAPSKAVSLFVSALTLSIAIVAGLVIWAALANPGMNPFT
jgi:hypothetical protein